MKHFKSYIYIYLLIWIALINGSSFLLLKKYVEFSNFKTVRFHIFVDRRYIIEGLIKKKEIAILKDLNFLSLLNDDLIIINSIENLSKNMEKIDIRNDIKKLNTNMYDITFNEANYNKDLIIKIIRDDINQKELKFLSKFVEDFPKETLREVGDRFVIITTQDIAHYKSKFSAIIFMIFVVSIITSFIILSFFKKIKTPIWLK